MSTTIDINVTKIEPIVTITATPNEYIVNINTIQGSGIESIQAGDNISVDDTDPNNPIVTATVPQNTSDLTNDGEDGENPFITKQDLERPIKRINFDVLFYTLVPEDKYKLLVCVDDYGSSDLVILTPYDIFQEGDSFEYVIENNSGNTEISSGVTFQRVDLDTQNFVGNPSLFANYDGGNYYNDKGFVTLQQKTLDSELWSFSYQSGTSSSTAPVPPLDRVLQKGDRIYKEIGSDYTFEVEDRAKRLFVLAGGDVLTLEDDGSFPLHSTIPFTIDGDYTLEAIDTDLRLSSDLTTTVTEVSLTSGDVCELCKAGTDPIWILTITNKSSGGVTSVGLTMPSAFTVTNSPITSSGDIAVTGAGTVSQYVRGDGSLANFPTSSGGGASLSFYLNGSVSQGTFGGVAFREMDRTPILGSGTNFNINTNGYIQSFITDAGVPNLLEIPTGNWNFETYFSASSGGGTPSFYIELYKWDGVTLSLIASSSTNPTGITNGTVTDLYVSALAVPQTTLLATDRLAVRIWVNNSGRTITLHTEDNNICQVITTFSTGLTALNGLTAQVQNLAVGTSGTDFAISSTSATHTFNLPTASAANRGALSSSDWSTFNSKASIAYVDAKVTDAIVDGVTTVAPSQNAVFDALALKQDTLTETNFGNFMNARTAKNTLVDADEVVSDDSADSSKAKKTTWLNVWNNYLKGKADAIYATISNLNLKANLASPTFTGTVVLPSTTSIGNVSATELATLDGVTDWIDISNTSTIVGFSSFTTKIIYYKVLDSKTLIVKVNLQGTSNATTLTFTIPFTSANTVQNLMAAAVVNNGITSVIPSFIGCQPNTNLVNIARDANGTAFTSSGIKVGTGFLIIELP